MKVMAERVIEDGPQRELMAQSSVVSVPFQSDAESLKTGLPRGGYLDDGRGIEKGDGYVLI